MASKTIQATGSKGHHTFKLAVNDDSTYIGGLTIFGKNFGNYNQDINVRINYSPITSEQ